MADLINAEIVGIVTSTQVVSCAHTGSSRVGENGGVDRNLCIRENHSIHIERLPLTMYAIAASYPMRTQLRPGKIWWRSPMSSGQHEVRSGITHWRRSKPRERHRRTVNLEPRRSFFAPEPSSANHFPTAVRATYIQRHPILT